MIKLLIFDFDGTLCDTLPGISTAINKVLTQRGARAISALDATQYIGAGLNELARRLSADLHQDTVDMPTLAEEFRQHYKKVFLQQSLLYSGVSEFLSQWPHQLAIASNKSQYFLHELVKSTPLTQFNWQAIIGGDTFEFKKPHPLPLLHCLQVAGVSAHETLMIGDGVADVEAAVAAGIRCVAVDFGYTAAQTLLDKGAIAKISNFDSLLATIELLSRG